MSDVRCPTCGTINTAELLPGTARDETHDHYCCECPTTFAERKPIPIDGPAPRDDGRTNYCPMCVEAQKEIAELKAARLKPIDDCIEYFSGCASKLMATDFICGALETIRARYKEKVK